MSENTFGLITNLIFTLCNSFHAAFAFVSVSSKISLILWAHSALISSTLTINFDKYALCGLSNKPYTKYGIQYVLNCLIFQYFPNFIGSYHAQNLVTLLMNQ